MNELERKLIDDSQSYIETFFEIKSKDRRIIPFVLNPIQKHYLENRSFTVDFGRGIRDLILKARQHGFSTLILALFAHDTFTNFGVNTVIVGHDEDAMEKLLQAIRMMYYSVPEEDRPELGYDNKGELYFPKLNSRIYISTYRMLKLRSQTVNNLLLTELAFWKAKDLNVQVAGMFEAVPMDGNIVIESTPNGIGGLFWQYVMDAKKGDSIWKLFEYPWYLNPEYRIPKERWQYLPPKIRPKNKKKLNLDDYEKRLSDEKKLTPGQIMWRRYKMVSLGDMRTDNKGVKTSRLFSQENGCEFLQSGNSVFDAGYLVPCTHFKPVEKAKKYVHGGDTAEGVEGGCYNVLYTMDLDTGEVVNKIRGLWKPGDFAIRVHNVAMKYGGLVGIENNNTGHAVLLKLLELWNAEAVNIQSSCKDDIQTAMNKVPYRIYSEKRKYGWSTNELSRKTMFIEGEEALREGYIKLAFEDEEGIEELKACQYNDRMKEEAPDGMYDDSIMALLIAWQMRKYYQFYFKDIEDQRVSARII